MSPGRDERFLVLLSLGSLKSLRHVDDERPNRDGRRRGGGCQQQ